ncbi:protein kinase domain-containing protein [Actinophytocola sp.]|uniref:serine/threonine-protein kinase n=1 Tax=Actinophytocola sp. TaxID=1872138 RepID=UPI00389A2407
MRSDDVIADRYRLVDVVDIVGAGDTWVAWLADDLRGHRQVALRRPVETRAGVRADLERVAELAGTFAHPKAVRVYGVAGDGDECWLVTEYFPATALAVKGTLPPRAVAAIGAQVAGALAAAHAAGVVHRDVAPGNVLVAGNGTAKVTDFGVAEWTAGSGEVAGTPAYVSPEVAAGDPATPASDVFSLGATLFAAVEGEPPFGTGDPAACLRRIRSRRAEIPVRAGPLKLVLDAMLQRDPAARPTAAQAKEMLDRVASGQSVPAWPGVPTRSPALLLIAGAVAVVALIVLALVHPWESEADGPARTVLGDPRTADPCAVADAAVLGRFGQATLDANRGGFNRCDVLIAVAGDDEIDVEFEFAAASTGRATESSRVVRHAPKRDGGDCEITLTLADQAALTVAARSDDDVDTDFCVVAAVAADHAESVLAHHRQVPRRAAPDQRSLADIRACDLIPTAELAAVPAYANAVPQPGFGDWSCRWQSPAGVLRVIFDRDGLDGARAGEKLALSGREAYVVPNGYGDFSCVTRIFHLRHRDADGNSHVELALVVAEGGAAMTELCQVARTYAAPVAARLPALGG